MLLALPALLAAGLLSCTPRLYQLPKGFYGIESIFLLLGLMRYARNRGSFCNRTCFGDIPERTVLIARARKDAKLCLRAAAGSRRFYAAEKFTPEQVRKDETCDWKTTKIFYGGRRRKIRYKETKDVYWQRGAGKRPLRLIVIAPTPYRKSKNLDPA